MSPQGRVAPQPSLLSAQNSIEREWAAWGVGQWAFQREREVDSRKLRQPLNASPLKSFRPKWKEKSFEDSNKPLPPWVTPRRSPKQPAGDGSKQKKTPLYRARGFPQVLDFATPARPPPTPHYPRMPRQQVDTSHSNPLRERRLGLPPDRDPVVATTANNAPLPRMPTFGEGANDPPLPKRDKSLEPPRRPCLLAHRQPPVSVEKRLTPNPKNETEWFMETVVSPSKLFEEVESAKEGEPDHKLWLRPNRVEGVKSGLQANAETVLEALRKDTGVRYNLLRAGSFQGRVRSASSFISRTRSRSSSVDRDDSDLEGCPERGRMDSVVEDDEHWRGFLQKPLEKPNVKWELADSQKATGERARKELLCGWCSKYWMFEGLGKSELEEVAAEFSIIPFRKNGPVLHKGAFVEESAYIVMFGALEAIVVPDEAHHSTQHLRYYTPGDIIPGGGEIYESVRAELSGMMLGFFAGSKVHTLVKNALESAMWKPGRSLIPMSKELEWGKILTEFLAFDTDGDRRLTPDQLRGLFQKLKFGYTSEQFYRGLRESTLLDHDHMIPLDGDDGFAEFWTECNFSDPFGVLGERVIPGVHYPDTHFISTPPGSPLGAQTEILDQSGWKVADHDDDEIYEDDEAQAAEAVQVMMRGYAIAENAPGHKWSRPLDVADVRMMLLDLGFRNKNPNLPLSHETVKECIKDCYPVRDGVSEMPTDIHAAKIDAEKFISWATTAGRMLRDQTRQKEQAMMQKLQAILLGRGTGVHTNTGWNKLSNTVTDIIQTAPILGGSFKAKNRSNRGLGALVFPDAATDSMGGLFDSKGNESSRTPSGGQSASLTPSGYQSVQSPSVSSPERSAQSPDQIKSNALKTLKSLSPSKARSWMMDSMQEPEESPAESSKESGLDTKGKMALLTSMGGPVRVSSFRTMPGEAAPVVETYSLNKREPIKVTQSLRTERALGGIDLVQKRHQFVELPEYLLKEYWDILKKSMREIAGPKTSKYAKVNCAEWLQSLRANVDSIALKIVLTHSTPSGHVLEKEKCATAFEEMAGATRRDVIFEDFLHYYGPRPKNQASGAQSQA